MSRRMASRMARVVSACVLASGLAGCASLTDSVTATVPTSGPIEEGQQVGVNPADNFIRVIARGPSKGMSPSQLVAGFLEASASFDDNHAVAREYLTAEASRTWKTDAGVRVYEGVPDMADLAQNVVLSAVQTEEILPNGHVDVTGPGRELRERFHVSREGSEWRIDELPEGLLLSQQDVERAFRSYAVYFFNPQFDMLVPDARLLPVTGSGLATTLVRRLMDGPNDWLGPAVRTGFPAKVGLNIESVPIDAGVAHVDLTANARQLDDRTRQAMAQQLVWTLRQVPDVQRVDITAAGQPFIVPGHSMPLGRDTWPGVDPNAMPIGALGYAARPEGAVVLTVDGATPVRGGLGTGEVPLVDIAVAADESRIAGISEDGSVWQALLADDSQPIRIRDSGAPLSIAFDRSSSAWVVDEEEGVIAISGGGVSTPVRMVGLGGRATVLRAVPSRDGTRVALIVRRGALTVVLLARVVRGSGASGSIVVSAPRRVESQLVEVADLAWAGADLLSVLGSQTPGTVQSYELNLATGALSATSSPAGPLTVAAAPGMPTLIGSSDGLVYENNSGVWLERVRGGAPVYP